MIKCDKSCVEIEGTGLDILVEYIAVTKSIIRTLKRENFPDPFIDHVIKTAQDVAKMSDEEIGQKNREIEVLKMMKDLCK